MSIQLKFFSIPVMTDSEEEEALNKFLRSVKVLELSKQLVMIGDAAYWSTCVSYLTSNQLDSSLTLGKKVDYKEILSDTEFKKFCQLRKFRKQLADEDAVPAFAVFTDSELSEIAKTDSVTLTTLKQIKGIGVKKLEKYGKKLCDLFESIDKNEENIESV